MKKLTGFKNSKWFGNRKLGLTSLAIIADNLGQILDSPTLVLNFATNTYEKEV